MPIPNFVPTPMGLAAAYHDAMGNVGFGGGMPFGSSTRHADGRGGQPRRQGATARLNSNMLAQISSRHASGADPPAMTRTAVGSGPGRTRRRFQGRLRQPHRSDQDHRQAHQLGRRRRGGLDLSVRNQPQPRRQSNARGPRGDRRSAWSSCGGCRTCRSRSRSASSRSTTTSSNGWA